MPLTTDQFNDSWPAAAHESWLCRDAFHRFQMEGKRQIIATTFGLEPTRESNIAAYSAYADFIQHLHGTYMALFEMEVYHGHIPAPKRGKEHEAHDAFLRNEADRRQDPTSKVTVPKEFGEDLRDVRNRTNHTGHKRVDPKAVGQITLQEFYGKYHRPFVEVLYEQIASGYLDRHAASGKWDAIEGFSMIAGNAVRHLSMLESKIDYFGGILATGISHIHLGLIDESSANQSSTDHRFYDLPILGAPPWDAHESWKSGFFAAWEKDRAGGCLSGRLGPASILEGSQRPEPIAALSGTGLDETKYVLHLEPPKATLDVIVANRADIEACIQEAGEYWRVELSDAHKALIEEQKKQEAERERIRQANRASSP